MLYSEINKTTHIPLLDGEAWKDITGYEGLFAVSNFGRVKRFRQVSTRYNQFTSWEQEYPEKIYKQNCDSRGYPQVRLSFRSSPTRVARVHRLVAEAFLKEPSEELKKECLESGTGYVLVDHIDDNPHNPDLSNLQWCSTAFNNKKRVTNKGSSNKKGEDSTSSKVTEKEVREIWDLLKAKVMSQEKIGEAYGLSQLAVSNINKGRSWSHVTGLPTIKRTNSKTRKPRYLSESQTS